MGAPEAARGGGAWPAPGIARALRDRLVDVKLDVFVLGEGEARAEAVVAIPFLKLEIRLLFHWI